MAPQPDHIVGWEQRRVGWVHRLLGRENRVKATSTEIAEDIAATVAQLADRLTADLRKTCPPHGDAVFMVECLILSAFPLDVIVRTEFGTYSAEIRRKLLERLFVTLPSGIDSLPIHTLSDFREHFEQRASEYMAAWKSAEAGSGQRRLGREAGQAIYGPDAFGINEMFACSSLVAVTFKSFKGLSRKYEICGCK
jgi:hypothetical protein